MFLPEASTLTPSRVPSTSTCLTRPASSLAVPGRWTGCPRAGASTPYEPSAEKTAAADRVIAELRGRGSPVARRRRRPARRASPSVTDGLHLDLEEMRWALRLIGDASGALSRAVRRARPRGPLARRPPRRSGWRAGRACGRSAPAARLTRARTPRSRSDASCSEEWSVEPERLAGRGAARDARRHDDADRPGVARARRRGHARPRARRPRMVAFRPGEAGLKRHIRNFGAWPRC